MQEFIHYGTAAGFGEMEFLGGSIPASIVIDIAADYTGTETMPAFFVGLDGIRLTPMLDDDGNPLVLSKTNKVIPVPIPCRIRVTKPTSIQSMGATYFTR